MSAPRTVDEIVKAMQKRLTEDHGEEVWVSAGYAGGDTMLKLVRAACEEHARNETARLRAAHAEALALLRECERELWLGGSVVQMRERIRAALEAWQEATK